MSKRTLTGKHFITGDYAIAEGGLAAGCKFFAGYPITPASPIAERMSWRMDQIDGQYIQMEDEIASMSAIVGASCGGAKSMTATSGPGISLMLENIGLAFMMEVPCVVVNVMRGGPSTGMPTLTSQGDIMQSRWGSHGDYEMISYVPSTVQECFDFTIKAFNAAEKYRTPVMVLADQILGLMTSNLVIPEDDKITRIDRKIPPLGLSNYLPYDSREEIPAMAIAGMGYNVHMTGLTHDERGYPATVPEAQEKLMARLKAKILNHVDEIVEYEENYLEDADYAVICFGTEARAVFAAVKQMRDKGIKIGVMRMKTVWPFPAKQVVELSQKVKKIIVAEGNMGQYYHSVREYALCDVQLIYHYGGQIHSPKQIIEKVKEIIS